MHLYPALARLLTDHALLFPSESDYPLIPVKLFYAELDCYAKETARDTLTRLANVPEGDAWEQLLELFANAGGRLCSYTRQAGKSETELLILVRFGMEMEGVKTVLVET